ncbi:uncharacterized protein DS421_3g93700 [Arachis hypogaea]|nr:uncharacterized protein DS421_3g93700 [Arachis hypogaea]
MKSGKRVHQGVEFSSNYSTSSYYKHATTLVAWYRSSQLPCSTRFLGLRLSCIAISN